MLVISKAYIFKFFHTNTFRINLHITSHAIHCVNIALLRYNCTHTPPKIAPCPPTPFPRKSIHNFKAIHKPGLLELRDVRRSWAEACARKASPTCLIQIQLIRRCEAPRWELRRWRRRGCRINAVCNLQGNGRIVLRDEIAPYGLKSAIKIGALVGSWWAEVRRYVGCVLCAYHAILVFVCNPVIVCEGFSEPV